MKLIHCADIHLDSRMQTNLTAEQARSRNAEITATFLDLIRFAQEQQVRAVLIAGDLFDGSRVSPRTAATVLDAMEATPGVDYLYLPGNHDEQGLQIAGRPLPGNVRCFGADWEYVDLGEAVIAGAMEPDCDGLSLDPKRTNIVMLHGQVGTDVDLGSLRGKNIDYLALGHIHSFRQEKLDYRGSWCYSGCLEGRGFDETGEKGFVLLNVDSTGIQTRFQPFARRTIHSLKVDVSDCAGNAQVVAAIRAAAEGIPAEDLVEVTLVGTCDPETMISAGYMGRLLSGAYYTLKIKEETTLPREQCQGTLSLKGEFLRLVEQSAHTEEEKNWMIRMGLAALAGEEVN